MSTASSTTAAAGAAPSSAPKGILLKMETSMVVDRGEGMAGVAYQHGEIVLVTDEAEAERWLEKGVAVEADADAKHKHVHPPVPRAKRPAKPESKPDGGKGAKPKGN